MNDLPFALDFANSILRGLQPVFAAEPGLLQVWGTFFYNILLVALGLGFVIFVHELGHFLAAKAFGVQCDKFYVGFDPPMKIGPIRLPSKLVHFRWGETEYGIGVIPLGGYVKMLGQDDDPRNATAEAQRSREGAEADSPVQINPRSYQAKSVFARMVIISAGVLMNLFTGILMAAIAFYYGVPYDATVVGKVVPGDPAWAAGLEPGDRIVRVNNMKSDELSYRDMTQSLIFAGFWDSNKPIQIAFDRDQQRVEKSFVGTVAHSDPSLGFKRLSIGFRPAMTTQLSPVHPIERIFSQDPAFTESQLSPLHAGDIIVGVDGNKLPVSPYSDVPLTYELERLIDPRHNEPVTLNVLRLKNPDDEKSERVAVDVVAPPVPMKNFGAGFLPDKIAAVQTGSLGEKLGVTTDMKPVSWEGAPIVDSFAFALGVAAKHGQTTTVEFADDQGKKAAVEWQVPEHFQANIFEGIINPIGLELPGTGIVFSISSTIGVVTDGSSAQSAGMKVGDQLKQMQLNPTSEGDKKFFKNVLKASKEFVKVQPVDRMYNTQYWITMMQLLNVGLPIEVHYERDGKVLHDSVQVQKDPQLNWPDRGIAFMSLMRTHKVDNFGDALSLGLGEIGKRGKNVLEFLGMLVTGHIPFHLVGGPGAIAAEATYAASKGISPLLMFLTLLSANLAIINFLPIPALDGGHMAFLTIEAILGRPVDEELEGKLRMAGVLGLLCLMAAVVFNDVLNFSRFFNR